MIPTRRGIADSIRNYRLYVDIRQQNAAAEVATPIRNGCHLFTHRA